MRETEKEYYSVLRQLDNISHKGKGYSIDVWYDVSSYDYFVREKEENYAQITINFDSETINKSQLKALAKRISKTMVKVNSIVNG